MYFVGERSLAERKEEGRETKFFVRKISACLASAVKSQDKQREEEYSLTNQTLLTS